MKKTLGRLDLHFLVTVCLCNLYGHLSLIVATLLEYLKKQSNELRNLMDILTLLRKSKRLQLSEYSKDLCDCM